MLNADKITYSIGHVSEMADIAQSTIRYWETVFGILDPIKTPGGSRRYTKAHIDLILKIKDLLHNQGFTIKGANHFLENHPEQDEMDKIKTEAEPANYMKETAIEKPFVNTTKINFQYIKNELEKIKKILQ
jgi:DNA-binding transcriptional MerR regulator